MKTAFELFSEEYGEDKLRWEICDYTPILEQFGEILIRVDEPDYQGDSFLIYKKDGAYGYLCFGWGSCSGCDSLQACSTIHEVQELMDSLYNDILWFNSLGELKDYFAQKDWTLEYSWHLKEFKDFLFQVEKLEDKVNMCVGEVCGDNRFEVIAKAKQHLLDSTNIHTSEGEMKELDSFLFRCWQMGWLKQYDETATEDISKNAPEFISQVREMRMSQRHYFVTRSKEELNRAKALERKVDLALEKMGEPSIF